MSVGRFLINSTLGLGGTFDVAEGWGLKRNSTDFDATLATYCVPDGPFVVVPLLGPATPRSLVGLTADAVASPMYWGPLQDKNHADKISYSYASAGAVNARERSLDLLNDLASNPVDFYTPLRSAHNQNRHAMNNLRGPDLEGARAIAAEGHEGVCVHIDGKTESRPKRKMGHSTFVGMTPGRYEREWSDRFVR